MNKDEKEKVEVKEKESESKKDEPVAEAIPLRSLVVQTDGSAVVNIVRQEITDMELAMVSALLNQEAKARMSGQKPQA